MKVRVKNLSMNVTKKDLEELFKPYSHTTIELKEYTKEKKKLAFIDIPDNKKAEKAVKELNDIELKGSKIKVTKYEPDKNQNNKDQQEKESSIAQGGNKNISGYFPYSFVKREKSKKPLEEFHDILLDNHYDIAFEITWRAITPIALNPCFDEAIPETPFSENQDDYKGYNRRWLTINNHLAISPFTVKSAIANGFANILGGCYRVNTKVERDREYGKGQYIYPGAYKRYRVAMDGSSKPGIIEDIQRNKDGSYNIKITPVKEYYLDNEIFEEIKEAEPNKTYYYVKLEDPTLRKSKPPIIERISSKSFKDAIEVKYHGPYTCGKDLRAHRDHKYRFYKEAGAVLNGIIPAENFLKKDELKKYVVIGGPDPKDNPTEWYQDLSDLKEGDFIYYEAFNNKITHIGKNFLFKALFYHEDAVSEDQRECKDLGAPLCPRCRMFGMTDKTDSEKDQVGYRGRFKSATLVSRVKIKEEREFTKGYTFLPQQRITLRKWLDEEGATIARQDLLPIQGPPKPNKRDVDGYFDKTTGEIKGAKIYIHSMLKDAENINNVNNKNKEDYSHELRNFAQVVKEGTGFVGVVGAENATIEEISALLILLNTDFSNHGFKLGLGKAFGLGSIHSTVNRVWIRKKDDYDVWQKIEIQQDQLKDGTFLDVIGAHIVGIKDECKRLKDTVNKSTLMINRIGKMENRTPLVYPEKGQKYWKVANTTMIK